MNSQVIGLFSQHQEAISDQLQTTAASELPAKTLGGQTISSISQELVAGLALQFQGKPGALTELVARLSGQVVLAGDSVDNLRLLLDRMLEATIAVLQPLATVTPEQFLQEIRELYEPVDLAKSELIRVALKTQQEIIRKQSRALLELSTPVIPLFDNILVVPLIGSIDSLRAKQVMDNLLAGIVEHKAEIVLIDISGVPVVDTQIAHHIMKTVQAARLLGARCILVGIRPEFAQTIVKLGIDFNDIVTKSSLQAGFELALTWDNYKLLKIDEE